MFKTFALWGLLLLICAVRISYYLFNQKHENSPRDVSKISKNYSYSADNASSLTGIVSYVRSVIYAKYMQVLPSPCSELLMGVVMGSDVLKNASRFKEYMMRISIVHVAVVSGYNMTLVAGLCANALGSLYKKRNLLITFGIMTLYAIMTGFQPPILRALLMNIVILITKYYGRKTSVLFVLIFTIIILLIIDPSLIKSLSFILSALATLGLVTYADMVEALFKKMVGGRSVVLLSDLSTSIAAQILVWPVISYSIGNISIFAPVFNMFLLWLVPYMTVYGMLYTVILLFDISILSQLCSLLMYPFLFLFVRGVNYFASLNLGYYNYKIQTAYIVIYYILVLGVYLHYKRRQAPKGGAPV